MALGFKNTKSRFKRKHKKSTDNQAEYYYPSKQIGEIEEEIETQHKSYSLRNRSRGLNKKYIEPSEDEFNSEQESYEEKQIKQVIYCIIIVNIDKEEIKEGRE